MFGQEVAHKTKHRQVSAYNTIIRFAHSRKKSFAYLPLAPVMARVTGNTSFLPEISDSNGN